MKMFRLTSNTIENFSTYVSIHVKLFTIANTTNLFEPSHQNTHTHTHARRTHYLEIITKEERERDLINITLLCVALSPNLIESVLRVPKQIQPNDVKCHIHSTTYRDEKR